MQINWWTLALQAINFLVLVWLLQRFLYRPVMGVIARRRAEAEKAFNEAARREALTDETRHALQAEQGELAAARDKVMADARAEIEAERKKVLEQAHQEAAAVAAAARAKIEAERAEAIASLRLKVIDLGTEVAEQLLKKSVSKSLNDVFLDRICNYLQNLPAEKRTALHSEIDHDGRLAVVSAPALDSQQQERWRKRLRDALGPDTIFEFSADPALIAGAELHFRGAILRFTWREGLEQSRRELKIHANAE